MPNHSQFPPGQLLLCFSRVFEPDLESEQLLLSQFSPSEHQRLDSIKSHSRRLEYLSSRMMMRQAMDRFFNNRGSWQIDDQAGHSPLVTNLPDGMHVNLSHSKGMICFAMADMPIGVDIEACEQQRDFVSMSKMFMNQSERNRLDDLTNPVGYFYRCWCVKEAWYKAQPATDQANLHFTGIAIDDIDNSRNHWHLTEGRIGDYYVVAASEKAPNQVQCYYFPDEESWQQSLMHQVDMPVNG